MHDQRVRGRDIETGFDDRGREQDIVFAVIECRHDILDHGRGHLAVRYRHLHLGQVLVEKVFHRRQVFDPRHHVKCLAAPIAFAQQRLADHYRIVRRHEGTDRQPIDRRRCNDGEIANTCQRQLQGARDRGCAQCQHVHLGAQLLQALLVADAEMLLLVDDQQPEIPELD